MHKCVLSFRLKRKGVMYTHEYLYIYIETIAEDTKVLTAYGTGKKAGRSGSGEHFSLY